MTQFCKENYRKFSNMYLSSLEVEQPFVLHVSMDISLFEEACGRTRTRADDDESRGPPC